MTKRTPKVKKSPSTATNRDDAKPETCEISPTGGESRASALARFALSATAANAMTAVRFATGNFGKLDLTESILAVRQKAEAVKANDLSDIETTLTAQAVALDAMFNELARRATINMGEYLTATETYLRLALRAQGQCRATLETLAEIKNPRPVAFVKQANIAAAQQINNGVQPVEGSRAHGKSLSQSIELLELRHGQRLDIGAPSATGADNQELAPLGKIDGATERCGQSQERG